MLTETLISKEEYFDLLQKSAVKLEYHAGEIVAMAGAQPPHNLVAGNLLGELYACLKKQGCIILGSDQLLKVEYCEKYVFPDLVIVCDEPIFEKSPNGLDALENPTIIIEIASDSTELYDRTEKFDCYKSISTLKEYVLVASKKKKVEVFKRIDENEWLLHAYSEKDKTIKIGDCEIPFDEIYRKVIFTND